MRRRDSLAAPARARSVKRFYRAAGLASLLVAFIVSATMTSAPPTGAQSRTPTAARSTPARGAVTNKQDSTSSAQPAPKRIAPVSVTQVSFRQLAEREAAASRGISMKRAPTVLQAVHPPLTAREPAAPVAGEAIRPGPAGQDDTGNPDVASPSPSQSFLAQEDGPKIGTTSFTIPPDTNGAVGLDRVFTNTNQNYRIHDKATGAALSTVSNDTFWASAGGTGVFDPQIQFDPYNQRWILATASNSVSANSSIEVAISQTSDPQGAYFLFRFIVGCAPGAANCDAGGEWADFPMLGFNKNWVVVAVNMFTLTSSASVDFVTLVLDYPSLRVGTSNATIFRDPGIGFCAHPATTLDPVQETIFAPAHLTSASAAYKVNTITGTPGAPIYTNGTTKIRPGGGWTQPSGDILPQQCVAGSPVATFQCPSTLRFMDSGDAFIRSNPVFRNNRIYYAQTVGLPAGGLTHTAAQWTVLDASGNFVDGGRVDDPTATNSNGGRWYAYPSITANRNGDILLGFSEFESDDFVDAAYSYHDHTDAAGTMRDPVVYKEGEDYYQKIFSSSRNRWGDYSHTLVDPSNDRDMWTIQEYAQQRVGSAATTPPNNGLGSNDSRWGTFWAKVNAAAGAGDLLISEFRLHGPAGPSGTEPNNDEYIEIYNNNDSPLTVATIDGSAGYAVAASDGVTRCTIPNGTVFPGRGHFLCVNNSGYSLASYPAGNGTTATGDATYTANIPANTGIAIFNTTVAANFSTATRLDAVGPTSEANALYREGAGYPALTPLSINYAFVRDECGKGGSTSALGSCPQEGLPKDTNDNAADFIFVDTNGTSAGAGQRLGAPGPQNLSSPVTRNTTQFAGPNLDQTIGSSSPPNRVRDFTSDPANNSTFGTISIRKRIVNNTGATVTRLRFRIIDLTTFPVPSGIADLRSRTSSTVVVSSVNDTVTCVALPTPCTVTVRGTTLEQPPSQPSGGGFNSSLSAGTVTLASPLANGASINVQFLLGVQQPGTFKFFINIEALP